MRHAHKKIASSNVVPFPVDPAILIHGPAAEIREVVAKTVATADYRSIGLFEGDIVIVDPTRGPDSGIDLCLVRDRNGVEALLRPAEIEEDDEILGVVWGFQRSFVQEAA